MERVGVRELRQNLSVYLRRVARGEALEVTEHGRPVAVLAPLPSSADPVDRLVAAGRARPAEGTWDAVPPPLGPTSTAGSDALAADREGRE
jgi:prevent-host-death family protein